MIEARQHKVWKAAVLKRDGFKCQFPNCNCKKPLQIHHIQRYADFPTLRFEISNGITLCKIHHKQITGMEMIYQPFFMQVVNNNQTKINTKKVRRRKKPDA
jgi:hypothetical protein